MAANRKDICLNMIVRNETPVLGRLFQSVSPFIDYYVIVDTGSTDGTQQFIGEWMGDAGISGEVHDRDWVDFGHNRQQALELAVKAGKCNWLLFIDADEELVVEDKDFRHSMTPGQNYRIEKRHGDLVYSLPNLIDITKSEWRWEYPVHEALVNLSGTAESEPLHGVWIRYNAGEGVRSRGVSAREKFLRDATLLERYLADHPDSSRCQFYLAQSYRDAGENQKAHEAYRERVRMQGWAEESYIAQLEAAKAAERLGFREEDVISEYLKAHEARPARAEALYHLSRYCRSKERYDLGYLFGSVVAGATLPEGDTLFLELPVYQWKIWDELSLHAYYTGRYTESADLCGKILQRNDLPAADQARITRNLEFSCQRLAELAQQFSVKPAGEAKTKRPLGPDKFVFTITPGHTGTTFLATFLRDNIEGGTFHHELLGYDSFGVDTPDLSHFTLFNSRGNVAQVRDFWTDKFNRLKAQPVRIYGETSHVLSKAGLMENLGALLETAKVQIICLRRNPAELVESLARRGDFIEKGNWWLWHLDPYYPRNIIAPGAFESYGYNGLRYWYVCEMYAREAYYKRVFAEEARLEFIDVETDGLASEERLRRLLQTISGADAATICIPARQNVGPKDSSDERRKEIARMIESIECDPRKAAEEYFESGRRIGATAL